MFDVGTNIKSTLVFLSMLSCINSIKNMDSFGLSCSKCSENNFNLKMTY